MEKTNMAPKEEVNVFLFVPNLIGYARVILMFFAFFYMLDKDMYQITVFCYMLSQLLDAFDGHAARALNQCSKLGAMLDMLTDRCSTLGLIMALGMLYPKCFFLCQCYAVLDIASHWLHLTAANIAGTSHKQIDLSQNPFLYYYYQNRIVLFSMCAGNEIFFSVSYLLYFSSGPMISGLSIFTILWYITAPVMVIKSVISLIQLVAAAKNVVSVDVVEHSRARQ